MKSPFRNRDSDSADPQDLCKGITDVLEQVIVPVGNKEDVAFGSSTCDASRSA